MGEERGWRRGLWMCRVGKRGGQDMEKSDREHESA
jgi:hypothetical protein